MSGDITSDWDVNLFFTSADSEGWSEHYILNGVTVDDADTTIAALLPLRAALMSANFQITACRLSAFLIHGDSYPVSGAFPILGTYTATGGDPCIGNTAIKCRLYGTPPLKGLIYMRGLDESIVSGRHFTGDVTFNTAFDAYGSYVSDPANKFAISVQETPGTGVYTLVPIVKVANMGITSRKVGRPFGLPVGHRHKKAVASISAAKPSVSSDRATPPMPGLVPGKTPSRSGGSSPTQAHR